MKTITLEKNVGASWPACWTQEEERRKAERMEQHQAWVNELLDSAEGGAGILRDIAKPRPKRGGAQVVDTPEQVTEEKPWEDKPCKIWRKHLRLPIWRCKQLQSKQCSGSRWISSRSADGSQHGKVWENAVL